MNTVADGNSGKRSKAWARRAGALLAAMAAALLAPSQARAQADVPFYANVEVEPNVFFVVNESLTMDEEFGFFEGCERSKLDMMKRVLAGRFKSGGGGCAGDNVEKNDSVLDVFGPFVNFALAVFNGSPQSANSTISMPNGGNVTTFQNEDNNGLKSTILAQSAQGLEPTTQAMRDAACWLVGDEAVTEAVNLVAGTPDPNIPLATGGGEQVTVVNEVACPDSLSGDPRPMSPEIDPSFECRRTFIILVTDGGESSGWGMEGAPNGCTEDACAPKQPERRKTIAAALRRMPLIPTEEPKIPVFAVLAQRCGQPTPQKDELLLTAGGAGVLYSFSYDGLACDYVGGFNNPIKKNRDAMVTHINNNCALLNATAAAGAGNDDIILTSEDVAIPHVVNVLAGPLATSLIEAASDGTGGLNSCDDQNPAVFEVNTWALYGGTDATPDPSDCLKQTEGDGPFAFIAENPPALIQGINLAIQCAIEGSHTRAEPTFVATSTNFSENLEIDGYFEIKAGETWWRGHLNAFTFETVNLAAEEGRTLEDTDAEWDAGLFLTQIRVSGTRKILAHQWGAAPPYAPPLKTGNIEDGAYVDHLDPLYKPWWAGNCLGATVCSWFIPTELGFSYSQYDPIAYLNVGWGPDTNPAPPPVYSVADTTPNAAPYSINDLIRFIRDEDGVVSPFLQFADGSIKPWSLGPIVHSSALIVKPPHFDFRNGSGQKYADFVRNHVNDPETIFVGAQDGMFHAFLLDDENSVTGKNPGEELWGFVPFESMLRLPAMPTGVIFTVDGTPNASTVRFFLDPTNPDDDQFRTILVFGLRGGGFSYMAMDITDPRTPKLHWALSHPNMGKTFSKANIGEYQITWDSGTMLKRWLVAAGAGYNDTRSDGDPAPINPATCDCGFGDIDFDGDPECLTDHDFDVTTACIEKDLAPADSTTGGLPAIGNWVLFWDIETGRLVQNVKIEDDTANPRYNSIPGDLLAIDRDLNGTIDNVIVGDVEGRLWKILTYSPNPVDWRTNLPGLRSANAGLSPCLMFDPGDAFGPEFLRPTFYAPSATFDCNGFVNMIWGTGDLTDPNNTSSQDYLFAINDPDASSCGANDPDMVARDFTCDEIRQQADTTGNAELRELADAVDNSFPFHLLSGEKILSSPLIINGKFFASTFIPPGSPDASNAACSGSGSGRIIAGPAICCRLQKDPSMTSTLTSVLEITDVGNAIAPLVIGPDDQPRSPSGLGGTAQAVGTRLRKRNLLHWVDVFGVSDITPMRIN